MREKQNKGVKQQRPFFISELNGNIVVISAIAILEALQHTLLPGKA